MKHGVKSSEKTHQRKSVYPYYSKFSLFILVAVAFFNQGCQLGYLVESAYDQARLLNSRVPINKALDNPNLSDEEKQKIVLATEAKKFAEQELKLKETENYTTYVHLNRPYVTYVVNASEKNRLDSYYWEFPIVGRVPYKGFFRKTSAEQEAAKLDKMNLDTHVRGVSAYSTLGWFSDPILSSMIDGSDYELVNTIIHETVHATIYIHDNAEFNERLATFLGNKGTELFYLKKEGEKSATLLHVRQESNDDQIFSQFIEQEIAELNKWYSHRQNSEIPENVRLNRLKEIQIRFLKDVSGNLKTDRYKGFEKAEINNAVLLLHDTYTQDLAAFAELYQKLGNNFPAFVAQMKSLEDSEDPAFDLKQLSIK